jgi:distribution and morphology protein 31
LKNKLNNFLKSNKLVFRQIRKYADEAGNNPPKKRSWAKFIGWKGPISMDKVVATINLVLLFPGFLLIAGTTTAISGIIWVLNRNHKWQEWMNMYVSTLLSYHTGSTVTFENAINSWKEGSIKLKNVKIVRDPATFPENRDKNVSKFEINVDTVDVVISFLWWLQGKGFLKEVVATGVSGTLDRTQLSWDSDYVYTKRVWRRGDLFLDYFSLRDVNITLLNPNPKRPLEVKIFQLECDKFRAQWLFHDLIKAKTAVGTFDNCLFTLTRNAGDTETSVSRFKIDGLNVDLVSSTSAYGPISWITEGTIDIESVLNFTEESDDFWTFSSNATDDTALTMDFNIKLNNLRASVPFINNQDISYLNAALAQPIVAFMNTNYTCIPLKFDIDVKKSEFDGAWTPDNVGLFAKMSDAAGREIMRLVREQRKPSNLHRHLFGVAISFRRGVSFLWTQLQSHYHLWNYNNESPHESLFE